MITKSSEIDMGACPPRTSQDCTVMVNHWKDVTIWSPERESARQHVAIKMGYRRPLTKEEHDHLVQIACNVNSMMEYTGGNGDNGVRGRCQWRNGFEITTCPEVIHDDIHTATTLHKCRYFFWHFQVITAQDMFVQDYDHNTHVNRIYVVKQTEYQAAIKDKPTHLGITVTDCPIGMTSEEAAVSLFDAGVRSARAINKQKRRAARRARQVQLHSQST